MNFKDNSGGNYANNNGSSSYVFKEKDNLYLNFMMKQKLWSCSCRSKYNRYICSHGRGFIQHKLPTKDAVKVTLVPGEGVKL